MEVSNSMEKEMCLKAAREAIKKYGIREIIHTDKGRVAITIAIGYIKV